MTNSVLYAIPIVIFMFWIIKKIYNRKYRYVGFYNITHKDNVTYCIDIPSLNTFKSKKKAYNDDKNTYRFLKFEGEIYLLICIGGVRLDFEGENFKETLKDDLIFHMTEDVWKYYGGKLYKLDDNSNEPVEINMSWQEILKEEPDNKPINLDCLAFSVIKEQGDKIE